MLLYQVEQEREYKYVKKYFHTCVNISWKSLNKDDVFEYLNNGDELIYVPRNYCLPLNG